MGYLYLYEDVRDGTEKEMNYFERLFDLFLDRLLLITDYFILTKRVSLTEMLIWWLSLTRAIWTLFVDVESPYNMMMSNTVWMWIYIIVTVAHIAAFTMTHKIRAYAVCLQALVWCMLAWLAAMSHSQSFALPTMITMTLGSVFVAVRLFREE